MQQVPRVVTEAVARGWPTRAIVLAAGEGTRLRPHTADRPKAMIEVGGRPLLDWTLDWLAGWGIREIAINLHYRPEPLVAFCGDGSRWGVRIAYSYEDPIRGSAGAVKELESFVGGDDFLVVYGDVLTDLSLSELWATHVRGGAIGTIAVAPVEDPSRAGIVDVTEDGQIRGFQEKPKAGEAAGNLANAGVYALNPRILEYIPEGEFCDFGFDTFPRLLRAGERLQGWAVDGYLLDIGEPVRLRQADADARAGRVGAREVASQVGQREPC